MKTFKRGKFLLGSVEEEQEIHKNRVNLGKLPRVRNTGR